MLGGGYVGYSGTFSFFFGASAPSGDWSASGVFAMSSCV